MRDSPVQVIPMEDTNNHHPKRGESPRAWTPSDDQFTNNKGSKDGKLLLNKNMLDDYIAFYNITFRMLILVLIVNSKTINVLQ